MRTLHVKLVRELIQLRWQALAICLVMACGVAMVVMSLSTLDSLETGRREFFARTDFADVFAHVKRAPAALAPRLAEIPGVAQVECRTVADVTLDVPGLAEPATARVVSRPDRGEPRLNRLHLRRGRSPRPDRRDEALVSEAFADAHGLQPGDSLRAILNGRRRTLRIVGVALSPEYVYSVRPGELLPDDKRFGVLWMSEGELAAALDLDGAFNDVAVQLAPGASEADVLERLDRLLDPYGGTGAFGRSDQASYRFLDNEMIQLRAMASLPPLVFLSVTAFLVHVVMGRLVATQREQIATLRAFGYTRLEIAWHYQGFAAVLMLVGSALGLAAGVRLGYDLTQIYVRFFRFPALDYRLAPWIALLGAGSSWIAAMLGTWWATWRAVRESPAQAMQPEPPAAYRTSLVERLGLRRWLTSTARMAWRNLEQRPVRALLSCTGVALAIAILVLGNFAEDTVEHVVDRQFNQVLRQDVTVTFVEPATGRVRRDLERLPGVLAVEPFRSVPVRVRFGPRSRRIAIQGLTPGQRLYRPLAAATRPVALPDDGLAISRQLADLLDCRPGDLLDVEVLEGARPVRRVPVRELVDDYLELNAYMSKAALHRLLREQDAATGAFLAVDPLREEALYGELKRAPRVAGVTVRKFALESYRRTFAENILRMKAINVLFASVVALGVVYNGARITLAERQRELASLRVLGFTRAETARVLFGELSVIVVVAVPLGWLLGYLFAGFLAASLASEVHRFPLVVRRETYAFATAVTLAAVALSAWIVRRRLDRLDLVAVLKSRD